MKKGFGVHAQDLQNVFYINETFTSHTLLEHENLFLQSSSKALHTLQLKTFC